MDSEGSQGSVLLCAPSPSLIPPIHYQAPNAGPSVPSESPGSISKPKKRRSKAKSKSAFKDHNELMHSADPQERNVEMSQWSQRENAIGKTRNDVQDAIHMMQNLQTATLGETQKPKRVRKRKKTSAEKEKREDPLSGGSGSSNEPQEVKNLLENDTEVKGKSIKKPGKPVQAVAPKCQHGQSPKSREPFFPDNRKGLATKKSSSSRKQTDNEVFEEYFSAAEVDQGLKDKTMVAGAIRINSRCYKEAYISSEGDEKDIMIEGLKNRNRALEGDDVVVLIHPPQAWKANGQRTGKVVYIQEPFHSRSCIGKLPSTIEPNSSYVVFSPRDSRVPRIKILLHDSSLPPGYLQAPAQYADTIFNAQITEWADVNFALGIITAEVGKSGDVEVETLAIMIENNLDHLPINPLLNMFFPRLPYTVPAEEIAARLDLRKECIFTIDPATARDLDDAVSLKQLDNGNVEVGVHISDVSHFLEYNNLLDRTVSKRATTVYLVQRVYHMLPVELCMLCSLTAGEDKLAFSVFVELTPDAEVVSHRFARSVIRSCAKLAYEHAQSVIDNPEKQMTSEDFPEIGNGFTAEDCAAVIRELFRLSVIMRQRRFATGALRIDQPKLCFHLDADTQAPLSSFVYENKESHRLIEEFMLLANMTVAEHIYNTFPDLAFLRQHRPPRANMMIELQKRLQLLGVNLDITDAGTLHTSMLRFGSPLAGEDEVVSWARYITLNNLCAKPMLRAEYFCPSEENNDLHHYALNAPFYTHFTSPIRRYADVMVHRLLASSLGLAPEPTWTQHHTSQIAKICNRKKLAAKLAGEQSSVMFLALLLHEPVESAAAVLDVKDHSLDVIVRDFGVVLRVYTNKLQGKVEYSNEDNMAQVYIQWGGGGPVQCIQLFSVVRVQVSRAQDGLKLAAILLPPHSA